MKLSLYYPAKPYQVTQGFGIYNPAYIPLGFDRHNGIDFRVDSDGIASAMCDGTVTDVGYNEGSGNYVKYRTDLVECLGDECYVEFYYMHANKCLVKKGDKVKAGDDLIIAGNTGFSTGPHTHISAYRLDTKGRRLDSGTGPERCFDFSQFYNGKYAQDIKYDLVKTVLDLATKILGYINPTK